MNSIFDVKNENHLKYPMIMSLFERREGMEYIEAIFIIENIPGVINKISDVLQAYKVNILEGFHTVVKGNRMIWAIFIEAPPSTPHEEMFKKIGAIKELIDIKYVSLRKTDYFDRFFFPITIWESRVIVLTQEGFHGLKSQIVDLLGTGGESILLNQGAVIGRTICRNIPEEITSPEEKLEFIVNLLRGTGWGLVEFRGVNGEEGTGEVIVRENVEADPQYGGRCQLIRGVLRSILREILKNAKINLVETACIGWGDDFCVFELV